MFSMQNEVPIVSELPHLALSGETPPSCTQPIGGPDHSSNPIYAAAEKHQAPLWMSYSNTHACAVVNAVPMRKYCHIYGSCTLMVCSSQTET